jgi:PAS domain S-box-containing protein
MTTDFTNSSLTHVLFEDEEFIAIYDFEQQRFVRVNQAGVQMLGYPTEAALLAHLPLNALFGNQPAGAAEALGQQLRQRGRVEADLMVTGHDGQPLWCHLVARTFQEEDRQYGLIRLFNRQRLLQTERDLDNSRQRYEAVFTSATIGIVVCDERGRIVQANQMADTMLGYQPGELLSQTIEQLVPASVSRYHQKLRESFNANPQVRSMGHNRDLHAQRKDGSVFPVEISLSYFRLDGALYVVAYIIDITVKKEIERQLLAHRDHIERLNADLEQKIADRTHALLNTLEQLEQSKDELANALAAERELGELKSRFVSMASHEFRTPLTAVLTSAALIEKYTQTEQQDKRQKHLDRIRASVNHLNDILEEFLSVGRLEEGRIEANPAEVTVASLVADTLTDVSGLLKPNQTIETDLHGPATVWLDPSLLRKILVNLLSNAIKYSGAGAVVRVHTAGHAGQLILTVADQGIGIAPDDQEHLFERFFRAKNATNIAGTGLGLHIVGRYVELMGGQITLTSELNRGTTVTITLTYENHSVD